MRHALFGGSLLLIAVAAGCAGTSAFNSEPSTSAIRAAEEVGAEAVPSASLHLQLAKEELNLAMSLSHRGKKDEATSQLLRAEADAELAIVLSRQHSEKLTADQAMERVRQLELANE